MVRIYKRQREKELWMKEWAPTIGKMKKEDYENVQHVWLRKCIREKRAIQILAEMYFHQGYINEQCLEKALNAWVQGTYS